MSTVENCNTCSISRKLACLGTGLTPCTIDLLFMLMNQGVMSFDEVRAIIINQKYEPACSKVPASGSPKPAVISSILIGFAK
jgi:hypothetical protein